MLCNQLCCSFLSLLARVSFIWFIFVQQTARRWCYPVQHQEYLEHRIFGWQLRKSLWFGIHSRVENSLVILHFSHGHWFGNNFTRHKKRQMKGREWTYATCIKWTLHWRMETSRTGDLICFFKQFTITQYLYLKQHFHKFCIDECQAIICKVRHTVNNWSRLTAYCLVLLLLQNFTLFLDDSKSWGIWIMEIG